MKRQLQVVRERTEYHGSVYFRSYDFMHRHTANCGVGEPHVGKTWESKRSFYFK
jgi:hypothetical protein